MSINTPDTATETHAQQHARVTLEACKLAMQHLAASLPVVLPTDVITTACMLVSAVADASGDRAGMLQLVSDVIRTSPTMDSSTLHAECVRAWVLRGSEDSEDARKDKLLAVYRGVNGLLELLEMPTDGLARLQLAAILIDDACQAAGHGHPLGLKFVTDTLAVIQSKRAEGWKP
jgi:hypothetical protein